MRRVIILVIFSFWILYSVPSYALGGIKGDSTYLSITTEELDGYYAQFTEEKKKMGIEAFRKKMKSELKYFNTLHKGNMMPWMMNECEKMTGDHLCIIDRDTGRILTRKDKAFFRYIMLYYLYEETDPEVIELLEERIRRDTPSDPHFSYNIVAVDTIQFYVYMMRTKGLSDEERIGYFLDEALLNEGGKSVIKCMAAWTGVRRMLEVGKIDKRKWINKLKELFSSYLGLEKCKVPCIGHVPFEVIEIIKAVGINDDIDDLIKILKESKKVDKEIRDYKIRELEYYKINPDPYNLKQYFMYKINYKKYFPKYPWSE